VIQWLPWSADAFARAAREQKPVLLSITAAWCGACHEMDATTYADPHVASLISDRFIAVRVDTDRRPDINDRYNLGGWPTTAFLTPDGALLGGGTFVPADRMEGILRRVADAFDSRADEIARNRPAGRSEVPPAADDDPGLDDLLDVVFASYDESHGGFGIEPKFPLVAPLRLALAMYGETGDPRWRAIVERTLDAMSGGGLRDRQDHAFFRYATTRDWQLPHKEKLLETNASLLSIYAQAAAMLGRDADRACVAGLVAFITGRLGAAGGGYYGSDGDTALYLDSNATATTALLAASAVLDQPDIARAALSSFERVLLACYRPGGGVAHYLDGDARVRGLLVDQIAAMDALVAAFDLTEDEPYRMMAEEIGHYAVQTLWDDRGAGFRDRAAHPDDVGLLGVARTPFVANCEAARVLASVARTSGEQGFLDRAKAALTCAAATARAEGPDAAYYLLARRSVGSG
jgi:uncharacterized protein